MISMTICLPATHYGRSEILNQRHPYQILLLEQHSHDIGVDTFVNFTNSFDRFFNSFENACRKNNHRRLFIATFKRLNSTLFFQLKFYFFS